MALQTGLAATVAHDVADADTAVALGSGDVPVLGTPRVVALVEAATVAAVAGELEPGTTTVGTQVALEHLAPSPVGTRVEATAVLVAVDGRTLTFRVMVAQGDGLVASGRVTRAVVDRQRFLARLAGPDR